MVSHGNLEMTWKVRENSENLKINGCIILQKTHLFSSRGKDVLSLQKVRAHLRPHLGLLIQERICSHGEQILSFKSNLQLPSDTVSSVKFYCKIKFWIFKKI